MTPQKQKYRHDPANGKYGDCVRTVIACLLDLDRDEVPHFSDGPDATGKSETEAIRAFLADRNFGWIAIAFPADLSDVQSTMARCNPGLHYCVSGLSRNDTDHIVICKDGEIVHDPAIDDSGIVGPGTDGLIWVNFITSVL